MLDEVGQAVDELVDVVDKDNNIVAQASRRQMRKHNLRHRATYIIVHDGMGQILVQRRSDSKDFYPGWLDAAAGGVVLSGEIMLHSARREAEEELGIADVPMADHGMFYFEGTECRIWGGLFSCISRGPFALQAEELVEVEWMAPDRILTREDEFTPDSLKALTLWLERYSTINSE